MRKLMTLVLVRRGDEVLLGMKKRGFGAGRWNGFGGKVLSEETLEEAAKRETLEEAAIEVEKLEERGVLEFSWQNQPETLEVHVFFTQTFVGEPRETEEMRPSWFRHDDIPYEEMWSDDKYWLPVFLAGKKFQGVFLFNEKDEVLSQKLVEKV